MHLVLNKKLVVDIANMQKRLIVIICVDTTNYYDQFMSLCMQYFRLEISYLLVLLRVTQIMKMLLYASFGTLDRFYLGEDRILFEGVVQGNGVVPLL